MITASTQQGQGATCIQRDRLFPSASAKAQTQTYSEDAFFLLCTAINPAILGKMYQSSKPFRIVWRCFIIRQMQLLWTTKYRNTQLNLNQISLIFSQSNVGVRFLWAMLGGLQAQPIYMALRGCPDLCPAWAGWVWRSLSIRPLVVDGLVCACWGCGEQRRVSALLVSCSSSVNMTPSRVVLLQHCSRYESKNAIKSGPHSPSHRWFVFQLDGNLTMGIPQPIQNWNLWPWDGKACSKRNKF